jgi:hypothetical protein
LLLFLVVTPNLTLAQEVGTPTPTPVTPGKYVRFDLAKIHFIQSFKGHLAIRPPSGQERTVQVDAASGAELRISQQFPLAAGKWEIALVSESGRVLSLPVVIRSDGESSFSVSWVQDPQSHPYVDTKLLATIPEETSLVVVIGSVRGHITAAWTCTAPCPAFAAKVGIDVDGNGKVDASEVTQRDFTDGSSSLSTPEYPDLPLSAAYMATVSPKGSQLPAAEDTGTYDLYQGVAFAGGKQRVSAPFERFTLTVTRSPIARDFPLSNRQVVPEAVAGSLEQGSVVESSRSVASSGTAGGPSSASSTPPGVVPALTPTPSAQTRETPDQGASTDSSASERLVPKWLGELFSGWRPVALAAVLGVVVAGGIIYATVLRR